MIMTGNVKVYQLPTGEKLVISPKALGLMLSFRQTGLFSWEAGGQLFATIGKEKIEIVEATGPGKGDWRSRFGFRPNRRRGQKEIDQLYEQGLHYVGDWHTHPEINPTPSSTDLESMKEMVTDSTHALFGYIMIIVGTGEGESGLHVSVHRSDAWTHLHVRQEI